MKVVVIGGGTGSFTVLRGLKKHVDDISAIVSMFDNGGSTGMLRDEFGILPPGDVRRCLIALAEEENNDLRELFMYRFDKASSVSGHSFGNLFLTALEEIKGSYSEAVQSASKILRIKGRVLPVSFDNCNVFAELENGQIIRGETNIDVPKHDGNLKIKKTWLEPDAKANPDAISAILNADLIVIGPGDLFTSIIPNFLVNSISDALKKSKAPKVYVCNVMTKFGETNGFYASDFLKKIIEYGCVPDYVVCNNGLIDSNSLAKYAQEKQYPVVIDEKKILYLGVRPIFADIISKSEFLRHDSEKLAQVLIGLVKN